MPTAFRRAIVRHAVPLALACLLAPVVVAQASKPPQDDIATLIKKLGDPNESVSDMAVRDLALLGEKVVPVLVAEFPKAGRAIEFKILLTLQTLGPKAKAAVPLLIGLLSNEDVGLQIEALHTLYPIGTAAKAAIPEVEKLWTHEDPRVRSDSRVVSLKIGLDHATLLPVVLEALDDPAPIIREKMVRFVAQEFSDKLDAADMQRALNSMTRMLSIDENANVHEWAVRSIARLGKPALERLRKLAVDKAKPKFRKGAIAALGLYRPPNQEQVDTLFFVLQEKELWQVALDSLSRLGKIAVPGMVALLEPGKQPKGLIVASLTALGGMGERGVECIPRVRELMTSDDEELRFHAASCLRSLGPSGKVAAESLRKGLDDESERVRLECVQALESLRDAAKPAIAKMIALMCSGSVAQGYITSTALRNLGPVLMSGLDDLIACFSNKRERVRMWAAYACGGLGPDACEKIGNALSSSIFAKPEATPSRIAAAQALGEIGELGKGAADALRAGLGDADPLVRAASAQAIGRIGKKAAELVPSLITALGDQDESVRLSAAVAAGMVATKSSELTRALIAALDDKSQSVHWAAIEALGGVRDAYAVPTLVGLLASDHVHDRWRAAEALGKLGKDAEVALPELQKLTSDSYVVAVAAKEAIKKITR